MADGSLTRVALVVSIIAAGCGGSEPATESTAPNSPAPVVTPTEGSERIGLSLRDHGRTIAVQTSSQITLVLGGRYRWTDPTIQGARLDVLALESDAPQGGQFWELVPEGPGRTLLQSVGSPACRPTTPGCPRSDRTYEVTLEISD